MSTTADDDEAGSPTLHARLTQATSSRRTAGRELDDRDDDDVSDSELFDELERELEEEGERGGVMGRLREDRMKELKRQ
jgi:hypothetical protein